MTRVTSSLDRLVWQSHVPILFLLIAWSALGLANPTNAQESEEPAEGTVKKKVHPERRAHEMFEQIAKTSGVDLDDNGKVSREERTAFLLALVGSFPANRFGLHDMHGNIWEWVADCYKNSYAGAPSDGSEVGNRRDSCKRVLRGGSWNYGPDFLRSALRIRDAVTFRIVSFGFRVARDLK